jgi:hypothetical protein
MESYIQDENATQEKMSSKNALIPTRALLKSLVKVILLPWRPRSQAMASR